MSSDVWNVAKQTNAKTMYETYTIDNSFAGKVAINDAARLGRITEMCTEMSEEFEQIIEDQNNYIIEFEALEDDYINKQNDIQQEIERLLQEVKELEQKEDDGTITDEEREELAQKRSQLDSLYTSSNQNSNDIDNKINENKEKICGIFSEKAGIASDYSSFAISKGNEFLDKDILEKEEKGETVIYIPWVTKYMKHYSGKNAIAAGEDLKDKVEESTGANKNISSRKIR